MNNEKILTRISKWNRQWQDIYYSIAGAIYELDPEGYIDSDYDEQILSHVIYMKFIGTGSEPTGILERILEPLDISMSKFINIRVRKQLEDRGYTYDVDSHSCVYIETHRAYLYPEDHSDVEKQSRNIQRDIDNFHEIRNITRGIKVSTCK